MLRRHFLLASAISFLSVRPVLSKARVPLRHDFLVKLKFEELARLSVHSISNLGVRVNHKIDWYGEFYDGRARRVVVSHTPDNRKLIIKQMNWMLDGQLIGKTVWNGAELGERIAMTHYEACNLFKPPTVIINDRSPGTIKEATEYIAKSTVTS